MAGTIYYTTEDIAIEEKRITRTCRAPMPNGKLCSRMDAEKCPFHGKIVDRDVQGAVVGQLASPTPAQDKELKEYSRKRKKTPKESSTVKQRLAKKIFNKRK